MNVHVYNELDGPTKRAQTDAEVRQVLAKLAADTGTRDLVVAVYLVDEGDAWRGHLASTKMLSPGAFRDGRGKWRFIRRFPQPASLPSKFFLIRIMIGRGCRRRKVFPDGYGMTIITKDFYAFLAVLFAHELHHFRRHHLGLHEGEREICANRWAVQQATKAGYVFQASWRKRKSRKMATNTPKRTPSGSNSALLRKVKLLSSRLSTDDLVVLADWTYSCIDQLEARERCQEKETH